MILIHLFIIDRVIALIKNNPQNRGGRPDFAYPVDEVSEPSDIPVDLNYIREDFYSPLSDEASINEPVESSFQTEKPNIEFQTPKNYIAKKDLKRMR